MLRHGRVIGAISVAAPSPAVHPTAQVKPFRPSPDQAAIAFRERTPLQRAWRRATRPERRQRGLTGDLALSHDVHPSFDTIARNAGSLQRRFRGVLQAPNAGFFSCKPGQCERGTRRGSRRSNIRPRWIRAPAGRAILSGRAVGIPDVLEDPDYILPVCRVPGSGA